MGVRESWRETEWEKRRERVGGREIAGKRAGERERESGRERERERVGEREWERESGEQRVVEVEVESAKREKVQSGRAGERWSAGEARRERERELERERKEQERERETESEKGRESA